MDFRKKMLELKRRLSDRKMYSIVVISIFSMALVLVIQYRNINTLKQELNNSYNRAFYDMVGYMENIKTIMTKAQLCSTPSKTTGLLEEVWRQANMAQENLSLLPVEQATLASTSKYLNQVGDFAYSLNQQNLENNGLTDEQYNKLQQLQIYSEVITDSLQNLENDINGGRLKLGELKKKSKKVFSNLRTETNQTQFNDIDKNFQEYPTLIYDGPFSDHLNNINPKGLTGETISVEVAKEKVKEFLKYRNITNINYTGTTENTPIQTYTFEVTFEDSQKDEVIYLDITKIGGHVFWMINNRNIGEQKISMEQAKKGAKEFLSNRGFDEMQDTYYLKEDGTAVINFAYKKDGIIFYPDLIKVKVALDTGEIVGFESKGYITSHTKRTLPTAKISLEHVRKLINSRVEILSEGLAVIPTNFKTELFTYEFKGKLNDNDFLIYFNVETGKEENILMIVDTENGTLTL